MSSSATHIAGAKVVLVTGSLQAGGAERQLSEMANYWARNGAQVTLATWSGAGVADFYSLDSAVQRVWLDDKSGTTNSMGRALAGLRSIHKLRRLLKTNRPHALLSFLDISNIYAILASRRLPIRVAVAERTHPEINPHVGRIWSFLRRRLYPWADIVVAQTQDAAGWLTRSCKARVAVIPNSLRELPEPRGTREPLIIAVGRLSPEKGIDALLRAFAKLSLRFPEWRVRIIGEGSYRTELVGLSERLGVASRVDFAGEERHIEPWLARAGLLVHASRREGFPNAVLEAMGMGLAVVCTNCRAGPSELIQDRVNGRLVAVDDVDAMADAMSELMAAPERREALGRAAYAVRSIYSQELIMQRWNACLLLPSSASFCS